MDHNRFDELLRERGWYYDNGWSHDSISWDCYTDENYGAASVFFVILARDGNGRVLKFEKNKQTKEEIWAGPLANKNDIEKVIEFVHSNVVESAR
jgi:hypothetical protein